MAFAVRFGPPAGPPAPSGEVVRDSLGWVPSSSLQHSTSSCQSSRPCPRDSSCDDLVRRFVSIDASPSDPLWLHGLRSQVKAKLLNSVPLSMGRCRCPCRRLGVLNAVWHEIIRFGSSVPIVYRGSWQHTLAAATSRP